MKTIYLIRHSKPDRNSKELKLLEEGIERVKILSTKIGKIDKIYSSPILRAKETAHLLSNNVIIDDRLKEREIGTGEFTTNDWEKQYLEKNYHLPNGESLLQVSLRMKEFIDELLNAMNEGEENYIVSHAAAICAYLMNFCEIKVIDAEKKMREIRYNGNIILTGNIDMPSIFKLEYNNQTVNITYMK